MARQSLPVNFDGYKIPSIPAPETSWPKICEDTGTSNCIGQSRQLVSNKASINLGTVRISSGSFSPIFLAVFFKVSEIEKSFIKSTNGSSLSGFFRLIIELREPLKEKFVVDAELLNAKLKAISSFPG